MNEGNETGAWLEGTAARGRPLRRVRGFLRRRVRAQWRALRPLAVLAAAATVLVLGTVGFRELHPSFSVVDAAYNAIQLFGFGGALDGTLGWELEVARILGPAIAGYAAIRGVIALSREQLTLLMFRLLLRDHYVVVGLGEIGFTLATGMHDSGARVVAIEKDANAPGFEGCRERGIPVLLGDATDPSMLGKARAASARLLVAVTGDDAANADVAAAAADLSRGRTLGALTAAVHIANPALRASLESWAIAEPAGAGFRLETFSVYEAAIRVLIAERPPFAGGDSRATIFVAADPPLIEPILVELVRARHAAEPAPVPAVTVAGPGAKGAVAALTAQYPALDAELELKAIDVEGYDADLKEAAAADWVCMAYLDEGANVAAAITVARSRPPDGSPVVVLVRSESSGLGAIVASREGPAGSVVPFGVLTHALTPRLVADSRTETLARAMHESYRQGRLATGAGGGSESLEPWDRLPETLKESNRAYASGIGPKLRALGYVAIPTPLPDADAGESEGWLADDALESLAELEHERWRTDLERNGWRHGPRNDPELKTHPSLVPYAELSEQEKEKDRQAVRDLPRILATAGFAIRRVR